MTGPSSQQRTNPGGPRGVDTQPKSRPRSRIGLFRMAKVRVSLTYITGDFPSSPVWTNKGTPSLLARVVLKPLAADQLCMRFQMVNQLGPPLEMFEAR